MKRRALDIVLFVLLVPGAILAWRTGQHRSRLVARYEHLRRVAGELSIADPSRVYLAALRTGEPLHYAWRVYLPPNYPSGIRIFEGAGQGSSGSLGGGGPSAPSELIARVRFREGPGNQMSLYAHFGGGSIGTSVGDPSLAAFVRAHARELQVEQAGVGEPLTLAADRGAEVLRLTFPDHLRAEAERVLSPHARSLFPVLLRVEVGPQAPPAPAPPPGG